MTERGAKLRVAQHGVEPVGERRCGTRRHEDPPVIGQQLSCVDVRRRDDGAARAHGVGHRPRHDLVHVRVRRHEHVRGLEPLVELGTADESIDEPDVALHAEPSDLVDEGVAVCLALGADQLRVGGADDDVEDIGVHRGDRGQRIDGQLVALARAEQAEAQDHVATGDAESRLDLRRIHEGHVRDAVGDHREPALIHVVGIGQQVGGRLRHHDRCFGNPDEVGQDGSLMG